jgi:hypothetical protein
MLAHVLPKASMTCDNSGEGSCRHCKGSATPESLRNTAVGGYLQVPRESRTGFFSLIILHKNIYRAKQSGLKMIYLVDNMKSVNNKMTTLNGIPLC